MSARPSPRKIAVIGNGGGGKTTLSRSLARRLALPLFHVDSIQYLPGMKVRPLEETRARLDLLSAGESWLIDGFGPLDVIQRRFALADLVIYVDFPLWRHYWWCTKRQLKSLYAPRAEIPPGSNEATIGHTIRLFRILWRVHRGIRPQLEEIFCKEDIRPKVLRVGNLRSWSAVERGELQIPKSEI